MGGFFVVMVGHEVVCSDDGGSGDGGWLRSGELGRRWGEGWFRLYSSFAGNSDSSVRGIVGFHFALVTLLVVLSHVAIVFLLGF